MRLIDADRLKRSFEANTPIAFQDCVPGIHSVIDCAPTVDAVPVRHGKWIYDGECEYTCSECGKGIRTNCEFIKEHKYCFRCGAKMDAERGNTKKSKSEGNAFGEPYTSGMYKGNYYVDPKTHKIKKCK